MVALVLALVLEREAQPAQVAEEAEPMEIMRLEFLAQAVLA